MRASSAFLCLINIGLVGFLLFAQPAYGNIYSPFFTPNPPISGQPIIYTLSYPACPGGPAENVDGELYWVNREGQNIQVIAIMPFRPCIPIQVLPPVQFEFDMGELPAGEYTLSYYEAFENVTFPVDPDDPSDPNSPFVGLVFETEFSVLQGPRSVPALNSLGLGLMLVLLLGIASWRLLASRSSRSG